MKEICEMIASINKHMAENGFEQKFVVGNEHIKFSEKEVMISMPFTLTVKIPVEKFDSKETNVIKDAVSQAISQAVSHPVSRGN